MPDSFVHLHTHTEYSMLDGASRVEALVAAAAADGQPALGITDHGNLYGIVPFYKACRAGGVKPILGIEAYMAHESRHERPARQGKVDDSGGETATGHKLYYHLTLLADSEAGYRNLIQIASRAFLEGYYYKPKVDWEVLAEHSEGILASTGCLGSHVCQALLSDDFDTSLGHAGRLRDIFGPCSAHVELQVHGIEDQRRIMPQLLEIARRLDLPLLATNDSHYTHRSDAVAHDALLCVQTGSVRSDPNRLKFDGDEHYLKTAAEMRRLFDESPAACDSTLEIAERCNIEIAFGEIKLPPFPVPEGFADADEYLAHLTLEGAKSRWGQELPSATSDRLAYELQVITTMGFASYFLIVWDLIRYARSAGIRVGPGRGSAAGCAVSYCLGITSLDPLRYDLLFERFLNPGRRQMPDIDMDFDSRYRDDLIRYAAERYGRDHMAQIITFSTIKGRAAVRDAARVLDYPYKVGDTIAKAVPDPIMGRTTPLRACLEREAAHSGGYDLAGDLRSMYAEDPQVREVVDVALGLEGLRRQDGIHAAAVVISPDPLTTHVPIQRKPGEKQKAEDAPIVTQYDMDAVEELGLLKMDFLGLRTLDVITDTVAHVARLRGVELDIDELPLDDERTYDLLQRGDTTGVFQLESPPVRALLRSMLPGDINDVAAVVALYRPGPMKENVHTAYAERKTGRAPVDVLHPDAAEILADTYGLMIYQESMMRIAQVFAGYSPTEADNLRKACGKKIREKMAEERQKFIEGCEATGYGRRVGEQWWSRIEPFADYAFNKSHSYAYGLLAYQTAYLKANYPLEYMAALLTSVRTKIERLTPYLLECRQREVAVLVPDVNESLSDFTPVPDPDAPGRGRILFGLSAVRNVGAGDAAHIIEARASGPFGDFDDFCDRVDPSVLNKQTVQSLIRAGAFDSLGHPRKGLLTVHSRTVDAALAERREREAGVLSLFGDADVATGYSHKPAVPDAHAPRSVMLAEEKQMLGLYISDHPLEGIEQLLAARRERSVAEAAELPDGSVVTVAGAITSLSRRQTRSGARMATFTLDDRTGMIPVTVFPRALEAQGYLLIDESVVILRARVDRREDEPKLISIELEGFSAETRGALRLHFPTVGVTEDRLSALKRLLGEHGGQSPVEIQVGESFLLELPGEYRVDTDNGLVPELRQLLGVGAVQV
ncbi:MAG: DNA polymerase III subunit alpha [bacterium]|nr:DNA polymerase III subunit alpha [bacterium]